MSVIKKSFAFLICFSFCIILTACGTKTVEFKNGKVNADTDNISIQLEAGETALLDQLDKLKTADLSGSMNYDEIITWLAANPGVSVIYTVSLPDGSIVSNDCKNLDLSAFSHNDLAELTDILKYLPSLNAINLIVAEDKFTEDDIAALEALFPSISVDYIAEENEAEPVFDQTVLSLEGSSETEIIELINQFPDMSSVISIQLGDEERSHYSYDTITSLAESCPNAVIDYKLTIYGMTINLSDEHLNLSHIDVDDEGATVRQLLPTMRNCTVLDMDSCGVADENMAIIRDENPAVKVIWRIWFGNLYSVRTDVKTIFASNPPLGGDLTPDKVQSLKYCTEVENLDLGHNDMMSDISFLEYMPNVRILILMGGIYLDARPIGTLKNLEYLEMQTNLYIRDISPVGQCTKLKHLNMCYLFGVTDISALYSLTNLERLWIGVYTNIPDEQIEEMRKIVPNCQINLTTTNDPMLEGWRYISYGPDVLHPMYQEVRDTFGYVYIDGIQPNAAYYFNDPLYYSRSDY